MARKPTRAPASRPKHPAYAVHPGVLMVQDWIKALPEKSGRSLAQWLTLIARSGPAGEPQRRDWLKAEHDLGTNTAAWLAERSMGKGAEEDTPEGYLAQARLYVDAMYAEKKAALKPIHDALIAAALALGDDVRICPCKTIVPLYRTHVFAQIKPATTRRVDLGLCLAPLLKRQAKLPALLVDTGGFAKKDRITHRIPLASPDDITPAVLDWLARAYTLDA